MTTREDRLLATLERLVEGKPVRRYHVRIADRACVVEAWSHDDAVKAATVALTLRGHDARFVRPAYDDDCLACGHNPVNATDQHCTYCGRDRDWQMRIMRGESNREP